MSYRRDTALQAIMQNHKEASLALYTDENFDLLDHDDFYEALYSHFVSEMPYGTAKARTGDPAEWITNRLA